MRRPPQRVRQRSAGSRGGPGAPLPRPGASAAGARAAAVAAQAATVACAAGLLMLLGGCQTSPSREHTLRSPAMVRLPVQQSALHDGRGRFREIFCAVLTARSTATVSPDCAQALVALTDERPGPARAVDLAPSRAGLQVLFVMGLASDCARNGDLVADELLAPLAAQGYSGRVLALSGLSSSADNARRLRSALLAMPMPTSTHPEAGGRIVLVAHSKGVVDSLEALVAHPEIRARVGAVLSLAGAVGGSPLADLAPDGLERLLQGALGADCDPGDLRALQSLKPAERQRWLATNQLPGDVGYFSIVALPAPGRLSTGLRATGHVLDDIDPRNDGNLLAQDQVIPQGTLLGLVNADHWAVMTRMQASPKAAVRRLADRNEFPRPALVEAALRYVEEARFGTSAGR